MIDNSFRLRYKNVPAAIYLKENNNDTILHNHSEFEIIIVESGRSVVRAGKNEYTCDPGDMVLINPMEIHSVTIDKKIPYRHKCICFDISLIGDAKISESIKNEKMRLEKFISRECAHSSYLKDIAEKAYDAVALETSTAYIEVMAYMSLLTAYMIKNNLVEENITEDKIERFYTNILNYITGNFSKAITSKDAARALNYNHSYFCRRFKSSFGMSFSQCLNMYRISCAKQLIESNDMKLSDIAFECGFSDPVYFSKCFKRYVGIFPSGYRRKSI